MRAALALALLVSWSGPLYAQGWIIPRPCRPEVRECDPPHACPLPACPPTVIRTASDVRVDLDNRVLRYEVEETFVNRGGLVGEADYLFPLPRGAAFQDLKLSINGELVAGETMDADEARRIYEEIVRRQKDPALVEWMGRGLLRTRIFPIAPGEEKKVVVRFQMIAEREGDAIRVDYFRGAKPHNGETRTAPEGRVSFVLTYPAADRWGTPYSPTHSVRTSVLGDRRRVEVADDTRELTLLLPVRRSAEPAISLLTHAGSEDRRFALITLSPPSITARRTPRDITFVLDVSGSMSGHKIDQARAAGKALLATLRREDRFRLIDFSTDVRSFRDSFVGASADNLREAERYLDRLEAEGSTNIAGALEEALAGRAERGRLPLVIFVTDGEPSVGERNPEAIAELVARRRERRRIFTFGLGADVNVPLIEQLALGGGGTAQFVRPEESVERAVSVLASRLVDPAVTDLRIHVEGVRLSKMHPSEPFDVFAGQDLVLVARYEGSGRARVRFTGETPNGRVTWTANTDFPKRARENAFIPRLWATQRIGYLSAEKRKHGRSEEIDREIRELGERYGIPTEFTSYFVREPGIEIAGTRQHGSGMRDGGAGLGTTGRRAAAPAARQREQVFGAARAAGELRAATSLADADRVTAATGPAASGRDDSGSIRHAGDRVFTRRDGVWVDARYRDEMRAVRARAYSEAYFKLLDALPELRPVLALGDRVIVAGRSVAIEVGPEGAEHLGDGELRRIRAGW